MTEEPNGTTMGAWYVDATLLEGWRKEPPEPPQASFMYAAQARFSPENINAIGSVPTYTDVPGELPVWKLQIFEVNNYGQQAVDEFIAEARERWPSLF